LAGWLDRCFLAIAIVHRLFRTRSPLMQTLKVRMRQLSFDIDARARELDDLKRQIEGAQEGGAGVACGRGWATKIGRWMRARKVEWRAEALEAQLGAISSSLENLPLASVLDAKRIRARKPPKRDVQRRQQASKHRYASAPDLRRFVVSLRVHSGTRRARRLSMITAAAPCVMCL
jgi:hypothetical protein